MAKNVLPVDFQDDILAESMNGRRKYQMITNSDGTVSFVDVTEYTQVGSNFGQAQVNATNEAVNESADKNKIIDDKDDLVANSQAGMMAGALAVKAIREELTQNMIAHKTSGDHDNRYYTKTQVNGMVFEDLGLFSNADSLDKTKFYKGVFQSGGTQYAFIQIPSVFSIQMIFLNTADADVDRVGFRLATESSFSGVSWSWLRNGAR